MVVYKITNKKNGKFYIGKTKKRPRERFLEHKNDAIRGVMYKSSFYGAIRKYGIESFDFEILEKCQNEEDLCIKEIEWIKKLDSTNREIGYNISKGGNGGDNLTGNPNLKEIRKRLSKAVRESSRWTDEKKKEFSERMKGSNNPIHKSKKAMDSFIKNNPMNTEEGRRKNMDFLMKTNPMSDPKIKEKHRLIMQSKEFRERVSNTLKNKFLSGEIIPYVRSEETKRKISESKKGCIISKETREKLSKSLKGRVMSEETRIKMSNSLKGVPKSEETKKKMSEVRSLIWWIRLSKDFQFIDYYSNGKEIELKLGIYSGNIICCSKNTKYNCGGFKWIKINKKSTKENEINQEAVDSILRKGL